MGAAVKMTSARRNEYYVFNKPASFRIAECTIVKWECQTVGYVFEVYSSVTPKLQDNIPHGYFKKNEGYENRPRQSVIITVWILS